MKHNILPWEVSPFLRPTGNPTNFIQVKARISDVG